MSKTIRFIGDVHGKFDEYLDLTRHVDFSIQVGDFGAGFGNLPILYTNHRFIRGNHDSPMVCASSPNWINDGHSEDNMFFVGGAMSIDQYCRVEGVSWWRDEELSISQFDDIITKYEMAKPDIMVSHECPDKIAHEIFDISKKYNSRTRQAFDTMLEVWQPKIWIFGHWHQPVNTVINGVRFICLAELQTIDLEV